MKAESKALATLSLMTLAMVVAIILLAGCGGGGGSATAATDPPPPPPPTSCAHPITVVTITGSNRDPVNTKITICNYPVLLVGDDVALSWNSANPPWDMLTPLVDEDRIGTDFGVAGATSAQLEASFAAVLNDTWPLQVIIVAGTADLQSGVTSTASIGQMAAQAQTQGAKVFIGTVPSTTLPGVAAYNAELKAMCAAYGYVCVDFAGVNTTDGVHPSDAGYASMWAALKAAGAAQ